MAPKGELGGEAVLLVKACTWLTTNHSPLPVGDCGSARTLSSQPASIAPHLPQLRPADVKHAAPCCALLSPCRRTCCLGGVTTRSGTPLCCVPAPWKVSALCGSSALCWLLSAGHILPPLLPSVGNAVDLRATPAELLTAARCKRCVSHRRRRRPFALCLRRRRGKPASWQRDGAGRARHQPVRQGCWHHEAALVALWHEPASAALPRCTWSALAAPADGAAAGGHHDDGGQPLALGARQPLVLVARPAGGQKARLALARAAYSRAYIQVSGLATCSPH